MTFLKHLKVGTSAAAVAMALTVAAGSAQTLGTAERFSANAIDVNTGRTGTIEINVDRWSTPKEREDSLINFFERTKSVMPRRRPGSLTDAEYLDVIAYVLQENEFPAGQAELTIDLASHVAIVGKDGPQPVPEFALIQTAGCLTQSGTNWILQSAGEPVRTRVPELSATELQGSHGTALGTTTFRLLDPSPYKPELHKDHKVAVKGLLIRRPDNRINVTAIDTIAATCAP